MNGNKTKVSSLLNSLRFKLVIGLMSIVLPVVLFLIYNNFYSIHVVRNQVAQSNKNMISLYMGLIDKSLDDIDNYLLKYVADETGLHTLDMPRSVDENHYDLERIWEFNQLRDNASYYEGLDYFFIYSSVNDDLIFAPTPASAAEVGNEPIKRGIRALFAKNPTSMGQSFKHWLVVRMNDQAYLLDILKTGTNVYIGAGVNANTIMGPLSLLELGSEGKAVLVDGKYVPVRDEAFFQEKGIDLTYMQNSYRLSGLNNNYLVIGEHSGKGKFGLVAVIPDQNILEKLPYLQKIIWLIGAGSVILLLGSLYFLRKVVLRPISRIVRSMRKIRDGHFETRIPDIPTSNEFELMNETFNRMVADIQKLKIDYYEEQLSHQKAELKQLQLQINPHFFLNSLNIVYYLAQENKNGLIQELALSLIRYFRFLFRSHTDYVLLRDELNHTENYLNIQKFRFPGILTYAIIVQDDMLDCCIPPLIIQTFAENTIKHALNTDEPVHVEIQVEKVADPASDQLQIRIHDSGKGFDAEVLEQLRKEMNLGNDKGEHIGIWNVKRRLRLLYGNEANILFYNDNGAVVEIRLPFVKGMDRHVQAFDRR